MQDFSTPAMLDLNIYKAAHEAVHRASVGKGQMGSALMGSLQIYLFDRVTFWVPPLTYFYLPKSARAYLFPPICQNSLILQRPISVDPICLQSSLQNVLESGIRQRAKMQNPRRMPGVSAVQQRCREPLTDGIGTPDPNPRNLVNWCF